MLFSPRLFNRFYINNYLNIEFPNSSNPLVVVGFFIVWFLLVHYSLDICIFDLVASDGLFAIIHNLVSISELHTSYLNSHVVFCSVKSMKKELLLFKLYVDSIMIIFYLHLCFFFFSSTFLLQLHFWEHSHPVVIKKAQLSHIYFLMGFFSTFTSLFHLPGLHSFAKCICTNLL